MKVHDSPIAVLSLHAPGVNIISSIDTSPREFGPDMALKKEEKYALIHNFLLGYELPSKIMLTFGFLTSKRPKRHTSPCVPIRVQSGTPILSPSAM